MAIVSPRASARGYDAPPLDWTDEREWMRRNAEAIGNLLNGKLNSIGTFTLTVDSLTTTVKDRRCGPNSFIKESPTTENAGGEVGIWFSSRGVESGGVPSFVVNHGFDSRSDRTFTYILLG